MLRQLGDLTAAEVSERVLAELDAEELLAGLCRERRAIALRLGGEQRYVAADDAGLYRDALGAVPPGGLPEAFIADVPDALRSLVARYARTHGPFATEQLRQRYGVDAAAVLRELERDGALVRGELRPGGVERDWCDVEVLRRLRRASLAALRKEIEPADRRRLAAFLPSWQGVDRHSRAGAGVDRLREVLVGLQGLALPVEVWERDVLPRRVGAYSQTWLDALCASGEVVWVGAGPLGRSGRVALYFREDAPVLGPPAAASSRAGGAAPAGAGHELLRSRLAQGPCFFTDLLAEVDAPPEELREALWDLVWAGEVTNDAWAPLRAPRLSLARSGTGASARTARPLAGRSRFASRRRTGAQSQVQGRWSLIGSLFGAESPSEQAAGGPARRRAIAELLLERYGIVTREQVLAEGVKGGFAILYDSFCQLETLGFCRRGYFLEGMGGAQFALPGAVERLRASGSSAQAGETAGASALVLAAADPAQPYGAALPWPRREEGERRPARVAGAYVVLLGEDPVVYVERGGRGLITLVDGAATAASTAAPAPAREPDPLVDALTALAAAVREGRIPRLALERIDGEPAVSSPLLELLTELGFQPGPRRLTLSA
jgi:ATP-dependent Lhr-like helicase